MIFGLSIVFCQTVYTVFDVEIMYDIRPDKIDGGESIFAIALFSVGQKDRMKCVVVTGFFAALLDGALREYSC